MKRFTVSALALSIATAGAAAAETHLSDQRTYSGIVSSDVSQNTAGRGDDRRRHLYA